MPVAAVEADLAERLVEQLREASRAIDALAHRRGSYLEQGQFALDGIRTVLAEYGAVVDRLEVDKPTKVNVVLSGKWCPGETPKTFIFDTAAECDAFKRGVLAAVGRQMYSFCGPDDVLMADGKIRPVPDGVDPEGPVVAYSMYTADGCEQHAIYGLGEAGGLVELANTGWTPKTPDAETLRAEIEISYGQDQEEQFELSGDQHRDLESGGLLDQYLVLLAHRDPDGADELLTEACEQGMKP